MTSRADVVLCGASPAAYFCARRLLQAGCQVVLLEERDAPVFEPPVVLWPGLHEHWGVLWDSLGGEQTSALLECFLRSSQLLRSCAGVRSGAVLQLACNSTEMAELTSHLPELNRLWPRRLMSSGSANNYLTLGDEVCGAAFVSDCCSWEAKSARVGLPIEPVSRILEVGEGWVRTSEQSWDCEVAVLCGDVRMQRRLGAGTGLLHGFSLWLHFPQLEQPWNQSFVGCESHRGHLMVVPDAESGWWLGGMSPDACGSPTGWQELLIQLAGQVLGDFACVGQPHSAHLVDITMSVDGLPYVGPLPGSSRRWVATGMGARDWSWGPALGDGVAQSLLGLSNELTGQLARLRPSHRLAASQGA